MRGPIKPRPRSTERLRWFPRLTHPAVGNSRPMTGTGGPSDAEVLLDEGFDAATLHRLRDRVASCAAAAGIAASRVPDIVLAVHELAANAVRHGAGAGRLVMHAVPGGALTCRVSDTGPGVETWPVRQGHGLWIARETADRMTVSSGPDGSRVTVVFGAV
jgi:anti-sigma regulatory factor (Ser/Thr protein kinase)